MLLDLLVDLASMITLRRFYATRFTGCRSSNGFSPKLQCLPSTVSEVPALRTSVAFAPHSLKCRSAHREDLCEPSTRTEFGKLSFRVAAPRTWNSLPVHLRSPTISRQQFQSGLKTSLQTRLHRTFRPTSENCWGVNLLTYISETRRIKTSPVILTDDGHIQSSVFVWGRLLIGLDYRNSPHIVSALSLAIHLVLLETQLSRNSY